MSQQMRGRRKIASFVSKLIDMLNDPQEDNVIQKLDQQMGFIISDVSVFTQDLLPRYFNHHNMSSFVRQLNTYGFRKKKQEDGCHVYINQNFDLNNSASLKKIKRRNSSSQREHLFSNESPSIIPLKSKEFQKIKQKQKILEQKCNKLIEENTALLQKNSILSLKVSKQTKQIEQFHQSLMNFLSIRPALCNKQDQFFENYLPIQNERDHLDSVQLSKNKEEFLSIRQFLDLYDMPNPLQLSNQL